MLAVLVLAASFCRQGVGAIRFTLLRKGNQYIRNKKVLSKFISKTTKKRKNSTMAAVLPCNVHSLKLEERVVELLRKGSDSISFLQMERLSFKPFSIRVLFESAGFYKFIKAYASFESEFVQFCEFIEPWCNFR